MRQLTNSAGAVTDAYEYDAFGNLIAQTGTTPNAYLYRSERYDSDLGLYYLRARWYNPATGRFMSRDPYEGSIYDPASLHRYNYARANPVNYVDPSGRSNLTEYALDLSLNTIATGGVVTSLGFSVKCAYFTVASSLHLVGETLGQQVDQFTPLFKSCAAKITTTQFVTAWAANTALLTLNVFAGPALTAVGDWMFGAEEGATGPWLAAEGTSPLGPILSSHNALEPGPLADNLAKSFSGGRYSVVQLQEDTTLYRAGTAGQPLGQFYTTTPPTSVIQARIDSAVMPVWPSGEISPIDTAFSVNIPAGTQVYVGEVSSQGGFYVGGTQQVVVVNPWAIQGVQVTGSAPLW